MRYPIAMDNVLLIDDDGKLAEVLTEYCAKFSIVIEPALLPSVGLKKLAQQDFDAVILDVMLPEMEASMFAEKSAKPAMCRLSC